MGEKLNFKGEYIFGEMDFDIVEMVCVPHHKYNDVDLCLKSGDDGKSGWNITIAKIDCKSLSFEEKTKLGNEITARWNSRMAKKG